MPYIGNPIYQSAFVVDQFSGNGSTVAFTMSVAPAGVTNVLVAVSGVLQDPSTYGVVGNTITFSAAPPSGTGNISCRYLGVPVTGVTTTAYRTVTEFTATASQTTFTPPSYTVGFINVYLNGVLLGSADYTATNGTTVVLATGASAGNLVTVESFLVSSVLNAIPNTAGSVLSSNIQTSPTLTTPTINKINDASGGSIAPISSVMRNRIINGAMTIDQRNAGASVTPDGSYTLDRWQFINTQTGKVTAQQNAGSVATPIGFSNYLGLTSTSAYSVGSGDTFFICQKIEGFNFSDLNWGTANAATVTLSFWVRSSLTGTFGGSITNSAANRSYPFNYTISAANTWEQKSITIAGDTTGTWIGATNGIGAQVNFNLGSGSTYSGTTNSWQAGGLYAPTGATSVVGTNGATFYITGVQLERGTQATSFEYRQYGTELALCQRYYAKLGASPQGSSAYQAFGAGSCNASTTQNVSLTFSQVMRASPSIAFTTNIGISVAGGYINCTLSAIYAGTSSSLLQTSTSATGSSGNGCVLLSNADSAAFISLSAEL